ncbi:sugar phosphate isomerase/epimerase [Pontiellaceae bacterium B12227]|nr:sugar phosphate isomerase/epimerase [Pontiellaceae bacterium B12227]
MNRETFITTMAAASGTMAFAGGRQPRRAFEISLAQWSVRNLHWGKEPGADKLDPLDFAKYAKNECGISGLEYVNSFYFGKEGDEAYFNELKKRADGEGVESVLIMCDRCGTVGDPDEAKRKQTVEKHLPWMAAAQQLGCHSIRVNAGSKGSYEEQQKLAADGLTKLAEAAKPYGLSVIVENHGGLSSNGAWLSGVMKMVNLPTIGTLPDFGNFRIDRKTGEEYDRYLGMEELMPFAKGVSAKSHSFDAEGNETKSDYFRIMKIVADSGYKGYVGVEWEGGKPGATEGILLTKALIERAVAAL